MKALRPRPLRMPRLSDTDQSGAVNCAEGGAGFVRRPLPLRSHPHCEAIGEGSAPAAARTRVVAFTVHLLFAGVVGSTDDLAFPAGSPVGGQLRQVAQDRVAQGS